MNQIKRQYTIKNQDTEGTVFIATYYMNGHKTGTEEIPWYDIDSFIQTLNSKGYERAQDLDFLFEKLENLQSEVDAIRIQIATALSNGNYVTKYKDRC